MRCQRPGPGSPRRTQPSPARRPARRPPRKLSCTCRSPQPGSPHSRRTPALSAMEPLAECAALLRPAGLSPGSPSRSGCSLPAPAPRTPSEGPLLLRLPPPRGTELATDRSPRERGAAGQNGAPGGGVLGGPLRRSVLCPAEIKPGDAVPWQFVAALALGPAGGREHSNERSPTRAAEREREDPSRATLELWFDALGRSGASKAGTGGHHLEHSRAHGSPALLLTATALWFIRHKTDFCGCQAETGGWDELVRRSLPTVSQLHSDRHVLSSLCSPTPTTG